MLFNILFLLIKLLFVTYGNDTKCFLSSFKHSAVIVHVKFF